MAKLETVGGLSRPSKMPCASWSTPATECGLGSKLAAIPGTTCSGCYARKGMYVMPNVREAMARRLAILRDALASEAAGDAFVAAFAAILRDREASTVKRLARGAKVADDGRFFRWHDSGDLHGVAHLRLIVRIAEAVPQVRFWLPTREAGTVRQYLAEGGTIPANMTVRLSIPRIDGRIPPAFDAIRKASGGRVAFSGVHREERPVGETCIAYTQDGACRDCRACWNAGTECVSYPKH